MTTLALDHLVVAAATLAEGAAWCERTLGVTPAPGGRHALFGTHNRLLAVGSGDHPNAYLEIISLDPSAPHPARPRWFGLDQLDLRTGPRLIHAVARSNMLDMHRWGLINVGLQPGEPVAASRETPGGLLSWQILVRPDGALLCGGALPTLIQWQGQHPAQSLPASGVALRSLTLRGVPDRARDVLRLPKVNVSCDGSPALSAVLRGPLGDVVLESRSEAI
jgi:Glyoxalase-like domain